MMKVPIGGGPATMHCNRCDALRGVHAGGFALHGAANVDARSGGAFGVARTPDSVTRFRPSVTGFRGDDAVAGLWLRGTCGHHFITPESVAAGLLFVHRITAE